MATTIKTFEFDGVTATAEWTEFGDRVKGRLLLPSGKHFGWEIERNGGSSIYGPHDIIANESPDGQALDRTFPVSADRSRRFRRAIPAFVEAAWAAAGMDRSGPAEGHEITELDRLETLAASELEGTPIRPAYKPRANRTCIECGSPIYGESCTHCHEG